MEYIALVQANTAIAIGLIFAFATDRKSVV